MPPVSWPIDSIFCAWRSCSSSPLLLGDILDDHLNIGFAAFGIGGLPAVEANGDGLGILTFPLDNSVAAAGAEVFRVDFVALGGIGVKFTRVTHGEQVGDGIIAEHADEGGICVQQLAFDGDPIDSVCRIVDEAPVASFALPQGGFGALALADVHNTAANQAALLGWQQREMYLARDLFSAGIEVQPLETESLA